MTDRAAALNRAYGTLLGQCVGDALGSQVEFQSAGQIARAFPNGVREIKGGGPFNLLPGQITDDSELALALARSLVEVGHFNPNAVAMAYVDWKRSGPFDCGGTCGNALGGDFDLERPMADQVHFKALNRLNSEANGALMRVSPLGIATAQTSQGLAQEFAAQDAALTHPNPVCQDASVVFTVAIRSFVVGFEDESIERAFEIGRHQSMAGRSKVFQRLMAAQNARPSAAEASGTTQGHVLVALQNAFHQAMYAPSFEEGIVDTVSLGGDTDTNAAIAGALLGAKFGATGIPERWAEVVLACRTNRPKTFYTGDLKELAEALYDAPRRPRG